MPRSVSRWRRRLATRRRKRACWRWHRRGATWPTSMAGHLPTADRAASQLEGLPLGRGAARRFAFFRGEIGQELDRLTARIDPPVNLAGLDQNRVTGVVGRRRTAFMFENERAFQDIDRQRTRMC